MTVDDVTLLRSALPAEVLCEDETLHLTDHNGDASNPPPGFPVFIDSSVAWSGAGPDKYEPFYIALDAEDIAEIETALLGFSGTISLCLSKRHRSTNLTLSRPRAERRRRHSRDFLFAQFGKSP